jgi:hypothetical protein
MKRLCVLSTIAVMLGSSLPVAADVCTFDDLAGNIGAVPTDYGNLTWSTNWNYLNVETYSTESGYQRSAVSAPRVAYNRFAADVTVSDDNPFVFNGAYLTGVWNDGLNIDITGSQAGTILHEITVVVSSTEATWVGLDWTDVDQVTFHSYGGTPYWGTGGGTNFAMDNFTFNEPLAVVPLPGTALLGVLGLSAAGWRLRRE